MRFEVRKKPPAERDMSIFRTIKEKTIEIIRVLHGARDLPSIFN